MRSRSWYKVQSIAGLVLLLTACAQRAEPIQVKATSVELPNLPSFRPPRPAPLELGFPANPWRVLKKGTAAPDTLYGLTPQAYGALALDLAKITKWIVDANSVIDYYEGSK